MRDLPSPRAVLTLYNGRTWINEVRTLGPMPATFGTREAAAAVGRRVAIEGRANHFIHDESGAVIEASSYDMARGQPRRYGVPSAWRRSTTAT